MPGIKTDTLKLNEAAEVLKGQCDKLRDSLEGLENEVMSLDDSMYCSAVPALKKEFADKSALLSEHLSSMERQIAKLSVIAEEYEDTERRNTDESYSIDRG